MEYLFQVIVKIPQTTPWFECRNLRLRRRL